MSPGSAFLAQGIRSFTKNVAAHDPGADPSTEADDQDKRPVEARSETYGTNTFSATRRMRAICAGDIDELGDQRRYSANKSNNQKTQHKSYSLDDDSGRRNRAWRCLHGPQNDREEAHRWLSNPLELLVLLLMTTL